MYYYYYYYDEYGKDNQSDILGLIKELAIFQSNSITKLSDTSKADALHEKMIRTSIQLLLKCKLENPNFTIFNNARIKKIHIDEDAGGFDEKDTLELYDMFKDTEFLYELVAKCFVSKRTKKIPLNNHIFYIDSKSKYIKENLDIYVVYKSNGLFVKSQSKEISLCNFSKDYLGIDDSEFEQSIASLCTSNIDNHQTFQQRLTDIFKSISDKMIRTHGFLEGAICFFDFLGWKGLWQNSSTTPLEKVTELIDNIQNQLTLRTEEAFPDIPISKHMSTLISISDTIAIFTPKINGVKEISLLVLHAKIARYILEASCKMGYPIRGAISYGEYSLMNNIMIGPGIDECASWHETCNWIGAHFTPNAQFILDYSWDDMEQELIDQNIVKYAKIPTKNGIPKIEFSVKWNISTDEFNELKNNVKAILPEIAAKYLNTYEFLKTYREEAENNGKRYNKYS